MCFSIKGCRIANASVADVPGAGTQEEWLENRRRFTRPQGEQHHATAREFTPPGEHEARQPCSHGGQTDSILPAKCLSRVLLIAEEVRHHEEAPETEDQDAECSGRPP